MFVFLIKYKMTGIVYYFLILYANRVLFTSTYFLLLTMAFNQCRRIESSLTQLNLPSNNTNNYSTAYSHCSDNYLRSQQQFPRVLQFADHAYQSKHQSMLQTNVWFTADAVQNNVNQCYPEHLQQKHTSKVYKPVNRGPISISLRQNQSTFNNSIGDQYMLANAQIEPIQRQFQHLPINDLPTQFELMQTSQYNSTNVHPPVTKMFNWTYRPRKILKRDLRSKRPKVSFSKKQVATKWQLVDQHHFNKAHYVQSVKINQPLTHANSICRKNQNDGRAISGNPKYAAFTYQSANQPLSNMSYVYSIGDDIKSRDSFLNQNHQVKNNINMDQFLIFKTPLNKQEDTKSTQNKMSLAEFDIAYANIFDGTEPNIAVSSPNLFGLANAADPLPILDADTVSYVLNKATNEQPAKEANNQVEPVACFTLLPDFTKSEHSYQLISQSNFI